VEINWTIYVVRLLCSFIIVSGLVGCGGADEAPKDAIPQSGNISPAAASAAKPIPVQEANIDGFQLKLKVGDTFTYKVVQENNTDSDNEIARQNTVHEYKKRVLAVKPDGSYDIGMEFVSILQNVKATHPISGDVLFEQHYNSKDTADFNNPKYVHLSAPIGVEVVVTLDKDSKFKGASGVDRVAAKIFSKTPNFPEQYKQQLIQQITTVMYATFSTQEHLQYPEQKLDSTYSWVIKARSPISDVFDLSSTTTSKITKVKTIGKSKLAEVEAKVNGEIVAKPQEPNFPVSINVSKSNMSGSLSALIDADRGTTITKQYKINMSVSGTILDKATKTTRKETKSNYMFYKIELIN
jgi:hypothetical protein